MFTEIDAFEGRAFERFVAELCTHLGWEAELTEHFDRGSDLILVRDGKRTAVQVKRAVGSVRQDAVQAVVTSKPIYDCTEAIVVTNSRFTNRAKELARANGVELWDRRKLERLITSFCTLCEKPVSAKVRKWCVDRPDEFGGRVYCFQHQRDITGLLRTA